MSGIILAFFERANLLASSPFAIPSLLFTIVMIKITKSWTRDFCKDLNFIQTIHAYCESLVAFAVCCNNFLLSAIMSYLNELVSLCAS